MNMNKIFYNFTIYFFKIQAAYFTVNISEYSVQRNPEHSVQSNPE